jgi:hypothetical protein
MFVSKSAKVAFGYRALHEDFCSAFPDIAFGGCIMAIQNCRIFDDGQDRNLATSPTKLQ